MEQNDFLDIAALFAFAGFTFVINTPLSIGFMIGGLVDEQFFTYGMIGCGVCGSIALICITSLVIPFIVEAAQAPARKRAEKEWEERSARQYEEHQSFVKSLYGNKESNLTFEERLESNPGCLEDKTHSYY